MIVGCALPLMILFLLPVLGMRNEHAVFGFLVLMFGCHLMYVAAHDQNESQP